MRPGTTAGLAGVGVLLLTVTACPARRPSGADASYAGVFADLGSLTCARTWGCRHVRKPCPDVS